MEWLFIGVFCLSRSRPSTSSSVGRWPAPDRPPSACHHLRHRRRSDRGPRSGRTRML